MKKSNLNTKKLLERALDYLIDIDIRKGAFFELNGKNYNEVTFSAQQVIDCMHKLSLMGDTPITSRSSFRKDRNGKDNEYLEMLNKAKIKRNNRLMKNREVSVSQKLSITELQEEVMALKMDNNMLRRSVDALNSFIEQAELEFGAEDSKPKVAISEVDSKYKQILSNLLQYLIDDKMLYIVPKKGRVMPVLKLDKIEGPPIKICNLSDVRELIDFNEDNFSQLEIKINNA